MLTRMVGAMPFLGVTLTMVSILLPIILIAVGSAYTIHIVAHYKDEVQNKHFSIDEHRAFVLDLVRKLLKPVSLAAITTVAGFISLAFMPLSPIRDFGFFSSFGVAAAFVVAMTFIPALFLIRGPRPVKNTPKKENKKTGFNMEESLAGVLMVIARRKKLTLFITAIVVVIAIVGATRVVVDNALVEFFNEQSEVNRSDRFIRNHFGGSTQLMVSVEADDTETLLSPETLTALDGLSTYLIERVPRVTKVTGFTDMIKRMNQLFNVEESPEGLAARMAYNYDQGDNDFGFGDWGEAADFQSDSPLQPPLASYAAPARPPAADESTVTFAMLASAAGKRANINANDLVREIERLTNHDGYGYYEIPAEPARYGKKTSAEL